MVLAGQRILRCPRKWKLRVICLPRAHLASLPHSRVRRRLLPGLYGPGCELSDGYLPSGGLVVRKHITYAITHPNEPNYLAIFSGSTQGVTNDNCPLTFSGNNIANQLITAGKSFKQYSEAIPSDGYTGCSSGTYRRKHNAAPDFPNVPA